jgi:predicted aspartyl protease
LGPGLDVGRCWSFNDDEQPAYPTIEVTLSSPGRRVSIRPKVDTGFNGSLAIGSDDVRRLRLTPVGTVLVRTATGSSDVPVYLVKISQPVLAIAYTTLAVGTERSLVGRKLLQNRTWLLDCKEKRFCIVTRTGGRRRDTDSAMR